MKNTTTICISRETHKKLGSIGRKNETFDDIIRRLVDNEIKKSGENDGY